MTIVSNYLLSRFSFKARNRFTSAIHRNHQLQRFLITHDNGTVRKAEKSKEKKRVKRLKKLTQIAHERASFNGPVVAIVGRTNVGKTKIFCRLTQKGTAIVDKTPGITRDRRYGQARLSDLEFQVIDTPGYEEVPVNLRSEVKDISQGMIQQAELSLTDADIVLFVTDGRTGVTPADEFMARWLKSRIGSNQNRDLQVILVANKCELSVNCYGVIADSARLGFGEPICMSAEETDGFADLWQGLDESFKMIGRNIEDSPIEEDIDEPTLKLAICGRPNVGKSTMVNRLVREYRCTTSNEAGTTRDPVEVPMFHASSNRHFLLIDTSGLLNCPRTPKQLVHEKWQVAYPDALAMEESLKSIKKANVVAVVVDVNQAVLDMLDEHLLNPDTENVSHRVLLYLLLKQIIRETDHKIMRYALDEGKGVVLVINKWDLLPFEFQQGEITMVLEELLPQFTLHLGSLPIVYTSAEYGNNVELLLEKVIKIYERWNWRLKTPYLNHFLREIQRLHPPPTKKGNRTMIRYAVQHGVRPPNFTFFCSAGGVIPECYLNRVRNKMREEFDLVGVPVRFQMKEATHENPYSQNETGYAKTDAEKLAESIHPSTLNLWTYKQGLLATDQRINGGGFDFGGRNSTGNHYTVSGSTSHIKARQVESKKRSARRNK